MESIQNNAGITTVDAGTTKDALAIFHFILKDHALDRKERYRE